MALSRDFFALLVPLRDSDRTGRTAAVYIVKVIIVRYDSSGKMKRMAVDRSDQMESGRCAPGRRVSGKNRPETSGPRPRPVNFHVIGCRSRPMAPLIDDLIIRAHRKPAPTRQVESVLLPSNCAYLQILSTFLGIFRCSLRASTLSLSQSSVLTQFVLFLSQSFSLDY